MTDLVQRQMILQVESREPPLLTVFTTLAKPLDATININITNLTLTLTTLVLAVVTTYHPVET